MVLGDEVSLADSWAERRGDREGASGGERRRYRRFRLELSVNVHLGGRPEPVTVEIVDIAARGVRFRSPAGASLGVPGGSAGRASQGYSDSQGYRDSQGNRDGRAGTGAASRVRLLDEASFGFVSREQHICVAHGRVLRVAAQGSASEASRAASDAASEAASDAASEAASDAASEAAAGSAGGEAPDQLAAGDEFVVSVERANAAFHSFLASLAS